MAATAVLSLHAAAAAICPSQLRPKYFALPLSFLKDIWSVMPANFKTRNPYAYRHICIDIYICMYIHIHMCMSTYTYIIYTYIHMCMACLMDSIASARLSCGPLRCSQNLCSKCHHGGLAAGRSRLARPEPETLSLPKRRQRLHALGLEGTYYLGYWGL